MISLRVATTIALFVLGFALGQLASTALAAEEVQESAGAKFAYGAGSALLTVVHVPLKLALCGTTTVLSGVAYLLTLGNQHVAKDGSDTIKGVCTGPYVITPQRLRDQGE